MWRWQVAVQSHAQVAPTTGYISSPVRLSRDVQTHSGSKPSQSLSPCQSPTPFTPPLFITTLRRRRHQPRHARRTRIRQPCRSRVKDPATEAFAFPDRLQGENGHQPKSDAAGEHAALSEGEFRDAGFGEGRSDVSALKEGGEDPDDCVGTQCHQSESVVKWVTTDLQLKSSPFCLFVAKNRSYAMATRFQPS